MRTVLLTLALLSRIASIASAQDAGPFVAGFGGLSAGDGSAAATGGASVGWMSARRVGFEIEIAGAGGLDLLEDDHFPRILTPVPAIFPQPMFASRGRLLTFQTNALVSTGPRGRWTITALGGGGVAHLRRRTTIGLPNFVLPPLPPFSFDTVPLPFDFNSIDFTWTERNITTSESALCLNAGGTVEFALTRRLTAGVDARYLHAFIGIEGLDTARVAARLRWRF